MLSFSWMAWFALPFIFIFIIFFYKYSSARIIFADSVFWSAFMISLISAFFVVTFSIIFVIPAAYFFTYYNFRYKGFLETLLIDIPQTFPPVAVGVIYLFVFGTHSPINIAFTFIAVIVAKLIVSAPFALSYTLIKFREIHDSKLDLIARSLGADTKDIIFLILIPLAKRDIAAGLTLCWARAVGEFGGSLIFAGVIAYKTEILPTYTNRIVHTDPYQALAATTIMTIFAVLSITAVRYFLSRK